MSDAPPAPRSVRDAIVHAAIVATAWALGELCVMAALTLTIGSLWQGTVGIGYLAVSILRRSALIGIAAAVAAQRRPLCSRRRAALECALIALLCTYVGFALALGSAMSEEVTGAPVMGGGQVMSVDKALERTVAFVVAPWTYLRVAGVAVGLYLASGRRGTWSEGLALRGPVAVASFNGGEGFVAVPIVAIAVPLLSRAAERLFARREGEP